MDLNAPPPGPVGVRKVSYDEEFLDCSWAWLNDPEIKRLTATPDFTREQQRAWFESLPARRDYVVWGVRAAGRPAGVFGLKHVTADGAEYWGYLGERELWGRGLGQWMLQQASVEAQARGLRRLWLRVTEENARAQKAYERFGFVRAESDGEGIVMDLAL